MLSSVHVVFLKCNSLPYSVGEKSQSPYRGGKTPSCANIESEGRFSKKTSFAAIIESKAFLHRSKVNFERLQEKGS